MVAGCFNPSYRLLHKETLKKHCYFSNYLCENAWFLLCFYMDWAIAYYILHRMVVLAPVSYFCLIADSPRDRREDARIAGPEKYASGLAYFSGPARERARIPVARHLCLATRFPCDFLVFPFSLPVTFQSLF